MPLSWSKSQPAPCLFLSFVVYYCKSCHLSSITAISCFFCLSCPFLFRLIFPVIIISFFSFIYLLFHVQSCLFLSCALFPVFLSFLSPPPVSPTRNLIPDWPDQWQPSVSQRRRCIPASGQCTGQFVHSAKKKIKSMVKFRKKCREVQVWGSGSLLLKSRIRITDPAFPNQYNNDPNPYPT